MKINNYFKLCVISDFFKNENKKYFKSCVCILLSIYFCILISIIANIKIETNSHSNIIFFNAFKYKKLKSSNSFLFKEIYE